MKLWEGGADDEQKVRETVQYIFTRIVWRSSDVCPRLLSFSRRDEVIDLSKGRKVDYKISTNRRKG